MLAEFAEKVAQNQAIFDSWREHILAIFVGPKFWAEEHHWQQYLIREDVAEFSKVSHVSTRLERLRARALLRFFLTLCEQKTLATTSLERTDTGKPFFPNTSLNFNVSHSNGYAGIAISDQCPVGIDIEASKVTAERAKLLATRVFSLQEREIFEKSHLEEEKTTLFLRLWTLKEALLKCEGSGIGKELCKISLPCSKASFSFYFENQDYQLWSEHSTTDAGLAVAYQSNKKIPLATLVIF